MITDNEYMRVRNRYIFQHPGTAVKLVDQDRT